MVLVIPWQSLVLLQLEQEHLLEIVVEVTKIYDNVGDVIRVTGVSSEGYAAYNQLYRITDVAIGSATTVTVAAASSIPSTGISSDTVGVGVTVMMHMHI